AGARADPAAVRPRVRGLLGLGGPARHPEVHVLRQREHVRKSVTQPRRLVTEALELERAGDLQRVNGRLAHRGELLAERRDRARHGGPAVRGRREPLLVRANAHALLPARLRGALEAPPSLLARRWRSSLVSPGGAAPLRLALLPARLPGALEAPPSLLARRWRSSPASPGRAAPRRLAHPVASSSSVSSSRSGRSVSIRSSDSSSGSTVGSSRPVPTNV